jgi:class 3 adenylate cyclase
MALAAAEQQEDGGFRALGGGLQERLQLARQHKLVSVLFADIVGFTSMCKEVLPCEYKKPVLLFVSDHFV